MSPSSAAVGTPSKTMAATATPPRVQTYPALYPPRTWNHPSIRARVTEKQSVTAKNPSTQGAAQWAGALAVAAVDVAASRRSIQGLRRWLSRQAYLELQATVKKRRSIAPPPGQRSVPARRGRSRTWIVNDSVVEVAVSVIDGGRLRAVALRLEKRHSSWLATALVVG